MDSHDLIFNAPRPSAERPLMGATVLVVEDSRFACEAIRLMSLRSGARIRRADSLRAAERHLRTYRPSIVIVDIGLPDGSGEGLIAELARGVPRVPVVLGTSGDESGRAAAMAAGADGFLMKPVESLGHFHAAILSHLPEDRQPPGPRVVSAETVEPDAIALRDDLSHVASVLATGDAETLDYAVQFLGGVALVAGDADLGMAVERLRAASPAEAGTALEALRRKVRDSIASVALV